MVLLFQSEPQGVVLILGFFSMDRFLSRLMDLHLEPFLCTSTNTMPLRTPAVDDTLPLRTPAVSTFNMLSLIKYIMTKYLSNEMTNNRGF